MKLVKNMNYTEVMVHVLHAPIVEPRVRVKDLDHVPRGRRHLPVAPRHVGHTYAIRGGIPRMRLFARAITSDNQLFKAIRSYVRDKRTFLSSACDRPGGGAP